MTKAELERIANQVMEDSEFRKANTGLRNWRTAVRSMLVDAMRMAVAPLEAENDTLRARLAESWQPVSDADYRADAHTVLHIGGAESWQPVSDADYRADAHTVLHIGGDGEWIGISHNDGVGVIRRNTVQLPPTRRLCSRTQPSTLEDAR